MKTAFLRKLPRFAVHAAVLTSAILATLAQPARADTVPQLMEDTTLTKAIQTPLGTATEVCESGAKWMRLNFKQLQMSQYDSLTLTSSGGDSVAFDGIKWNNQQFSTRALRGNCVQIKSFFGNSTSRFQVDSYQYGTRALEETTVTVAGVGDICDSSSSACSKTAALIANIAPVAVFTAGDNAYENGSLAEYNGYYNTYWGPFKNYTKPTAGNHEYQTSGAKGYFDYFNGVNVDNGIAGKRGEGYYSWDVGDWRFYALNSNIAIVKGQGQEKWLRESLAANTKPCVAAVFHHPLISHGNYTGSSSVKPLWEALYDNKADLVLVGHDHNYQRYAKADPSLVAKSDGIRQILVGTGGRGYYDIRTSTPPALLEVAKARVDGVLKLTLSTTGYTADFVPVAGSSFTDTVTAQCNAKPGNTTANFSVAAASGNQTVARGATSPSTLNVTSSGGFSGPVTLSLAGLPTGVTYALGTNPVSVGANASASSALTLTASGTASLGSFPVTVNAVSGSLSRSTAFTLTVTGGNQPPTSNFSFVTNGLTARFTDGSSDSDGSIVSRSWNFGDGGTSTATNPTRTYAAAGTYTVTLMVTDNAGATHTRTAPVTVYGGPANVAPVAYFTSSTSGLTATFTDSSTDSDGTIVSRSWNFGDGGTSTATNPTRTYAAAGTYTVTLRVTDNAGATNTRTGTVTVSNVAPVANFSSSTSGLTATFTDSSSDSDGTIASRSWNFGDGSTSTATNPTRTYATAGTYTVTLTVTDNAGASRSVQKSVTVTSGGNAVQLLVNPGFESGNVQWSSSSGVITNNSGTTPRSGSWAAWLNGYGYPITDTLSQSVSIPSGKTSATLSYYLRITSVETTTTMPYDKLTIDVRNASGSVLKTCATYSNLDENTSYVKRTCDLKAFIGQTVTIRFTGVEDETLDTSFRIDDTAVDVL